MNQIFHRNQYKILIVPIEETNIIYVQSFILSGRMNEDKKTSGISHLLEHILTESWKKCKDDCAKYWGNKGIITNASTGDTTINYYVEGLEKNYKELIEYIVKITTTPQFKESRIEVEKKAVREELNRELTDEGWKIADKVSKLLYNHEGLQSSNDLPLQIKNLKHLDKETLIRYCEKIYTPKNILFIVSGDVNKNKILKVFEKFLPKKSSFGTKNIQCNVFNDIKKPITRFLKKKNDIKIICTARDIVEIIASFINTVPDFLREQLNIQVRQGLRFSDDYKPEVERFCDFITQPMGQLDHFLFSLGNLCKKENQKYLHLIEYKDLIKSPKRTIHKVYDFLDIPHYNHNFNDIQQFNVNGLKYNDRMVFKNNIHEVKNTIQQPNYKIKDILPQYLIDRYSKREFWRN